MTNPEVTQRMLWNNSMEKNLRYYSTDARRWTEQMIRRNREILAEYVAADLFE